jgi:hypothetical protein
MVFAVGGVEERKGWRVATRSGAERSLFELRLPRSGKKGEFFASPPDLSTAEQRRAAVPPPSARPFFGYFLSAKRKKVAALPGAYPGLLTGAPKAAYLGRLCNQGVKS